LSWIELFKDSGAEELLDRREVHDMLQETIDSLDAELSQVTDLSCCTVERGQGIVDLTYVVCPLSIPP
jgi:hypothetical protein